MTDQFRADKVRAPVGRSIRRPNAARWRVVLLGGALLTTGLQACGSSSVHSPFSVDLGSEAGAAGAPDTDGGLNVGVDAGDPTLGGPCTDDGQCNDGIPCTSDSCDANLQRCRHAPDDSQCVDSIFCNGEEVCDPKLGCRAGEPVACADADPCTIDTCVEETRSCAHGPRDADGDGDPVWNCPGGGDCDDTDPSVSSKAKEICDNHKDDNCDGQVDEAKCVTPQHDECFDALTISTSGLTSLSLAAATLDYPTSCAPAGKMLADVVVALKVPEGSAQDVDLVAQGAGALVSLSTAEECGVASDIACAPSVDTSGGKMLSALSRLRLYGLAPGVYPVYVAGTSDVDVALTVTYSDASSHSAPPSNETCGKALELVPGASQTVSLVGTNQDLSSACAAQSGELVYQFTLDQAADVRIFANPIDSYGVPQLSLRGAHCTAASDELTCRNGAPTASLFARALPSGTYYLSVAGSGPCDVNLRLETSVATPLLPDEGCADPPLLAPGQTVELLSLSDHTDAVSLGCLPGAIDSSHGLSLSEPSDVLMVERISDGDQGAVSLALPTCTEPTRLSCATAKTSPVRAHAYGVAQGSYRVVAESALGNPVSVTAFTRKAAPETLVPGADDCSAPFEIPALGGRFKGNTANAHADFSAGCDLGNQTKNGAPDQILHLALEAKSRVVLDMAGSSYSTMLSVRAGATCPGNELQLACAATDFPQLATGDLAGRSFLDLDLSSGDYYVLVDGYGGDAGAWTLDVYVTPDAI